MRSIADVALVRSLCAQDIVTLDFLDEKRLVNDSYKVIGKTDIENIEARSS